MTVKHFLVNHSMVISHPPYSYHFTPAKFFSIPQVITAFRGRLQDIEDIKTRTTAELNAVPWDIFSDFSVTFRRM
jgi:hypothetical protein